MPQFSQASLDKLATCDPRLQGVLKDAIAIVDFTILEGHRNEADQEAAFAAEKTTLHYPHGKHNAMPSRAVDIAPVYYDKGAKVDWNDVTAFGRIMGVVQACAFMRGVKLRFGLDWDGDFRTVDRDPTEHFLDAPHVELANP